jgi:uncharacterized protein (TIGR00369 family)
MVTLDMETARMVLAAQPFSVLLGARLEVFEKGRATIVVPVRENLKQQNGFLHGGVLAYAADNAVTFAAGSTLGPEVLTSGVTISYIRPASGVTLQAEAEVTYTGRRQAVCRCDLYAVAEGGARVLSAIAQGSVLAVS